MTHPRRHAVGITPGFLLIWIVAIFLAIVCLSYSQRPVEAGISSAATSMGPLQVSPLNPRYFADGAGHAVYLTGSHTWTNFQDGWSNSFNVTFDFNQYLDFLQQHNHNFIRLWRDEMPQERYPNDTEYRYSAPHPWVRVGGGVIGTSGEIIGIGTHHATKPPPIGSDTAGTPTGGTGRFDLLQFNQTYFDRLRSRCLAAQDRGIYVSIMLFEGHALTNAAEGWAWHPFNVANNLNGIDGDPNHDGRGIETHTLQVPAVTAIQEAYVRKVIDTVNDLDNVLFEIANESHAGSVDWQNHFIDFIHAYEAGKPNQHPVIFSSPLANVGDALWQSDAEAISPLSSTPPPFGETGDYMDNPPPADGSKVVIADSDHIFGCGGEIAWIWKSFTRGLNVIYMDSYYDNTPFCLPPSEPMRDNLGYTRSYALRMNMNAAVPRGDLASTNYCLADVGNSYLVFAPNGGNVHLNLGGTSGTFFVEWLNPLSGAITQDGTVSGGGNIVKNPPFSGSAVLFLSR